MGKHFETFEHTADIGLRAEADSQAELYEALAEALAELVCGAERISRREVREMAVDSQDPETMAVDFLGRLLLLMQDDHFAVHSVAIQMDGPTRLRARVSGEPMDRSRHELGPEVKAVTYHMLKVREEAGRWSGQVLLDI